MPLIFTYFVTCSNRICKWSSNPLLLQQILSWAQYTHGSKKSCDKENIGVKVEFELKYYKCNFLLLISMFSIWVLKQLCFFYWKYVQIKNSNAPIGKIKWWRTELIRNPTGILRILRVSWLENYYCIVFPLLCFSQFSIVTELF